MKKIANYENSEVFVIGIDSDVGIPEWKPFLNDVSMQLQWDFYSIISLQSPVIVWYYNIPQIVEMTNSHEFKQVVSDKVMLEESNSYWTACGA